MSPAKKKQTNVCCLHVCLSVFVTLCDSYMAMITGEKRQEKKATLAGTSYHTGMRK